MSKNIWSAIPTLNDLVNYFKTGMKPSQVKNAGWDIMADEVSEMYAVAAGGTVNAITAANLRPYTALPSAAQIAAGTFPALEQWIVPTGPNTGPATFAPDGLTAAPIFNNGAALQGNELTANVPTHLKWDGTNWNLINSSPYSPQTTIFTAGGNFTPLVSGKYLVEVVGGGGGGGSGRGLAASATASGGGGGGGGAGQRVFAIVTLVAGTSYAVVVGAGGNGGAAPVGTVPANAGSNGSPSNFNSAVPAQGGAGGQVNNNGTTFITNLTSSGSGGGGVGGGNGGGIGGASVAVDGGGNAGTAAAANTGAGGGGGSGARNAAGSVAGSGGAGGNGGSGNVIIRMA